MLRPTRRIRIEWKRQNNTKQSKEKKIGFYFQTCSFRSVMQCFSYLLYKIRLPIAIIRERYCHLKWDKKKPKITYGGCVLGKIAHSWCLKMSEWVSVMLGYLDWDSGYNETVKTHKLTSKELN